MKKRILTFLLAASMILLTGCHSSNNSTPTGGNPDSSKEELTKLTLNEVAHSIFYAPMYVAIEKDYFRQEGISSLATRKLPARWVSWAKFTTKSEAPSLYV